MSLTIRLVIILGVIFFFTKVDFKPEISSDYFFFSADPVYQDYQKISKIFPPKESLILVVKSKLNSIHSSKYYWHVAKLTNKILALKGVESVFSLSHGPQDAKEANENLVWKEIVFGESNDSTLITSTVNKKINPNIVKDFEKLIKENIVDSFQVEISGAPYFIEMIKRYIYQDLKILILTVLVISAIMILWLFRSWIILLGTFITTISAVLLFLILINFFKISFGILIPNLVIVIFLLTQSHIVFLTSNYFYSGSFDIAMKKTFHASLWSMTAVFMGFFSLSMVQAKPLLELAFAGMIGTIIAMLFAYLIYPVTLRFVPTNIKLEQNMPINKPRYLSSLIVISLCLLLGLGIFKLETDTSIINYFAKASGVRKGMLALDQNGGSSTLRLIVSHPGLGSLDNNKAFESMHYLHNELASNKDVGAVVSLPLLMKESKRSHWITKFLSWNKILDILSGDSQKNVARRFMTRDRRHALFILRMKESEENKPKAEIIKNIAGIVNRYGFHVDNQGGPYSLQARLAFLVKSSLYKSLFWLLFSFSIVAILASRSLRVSFAMILGLILISLGVLGSIGLRGAAINIISFPAIILCLLLAMDIMIQAVMAIRESNFQFKPLVSTLIVSMSFTTLCFSKFIPMQDFGLIIFAGMVLAGFISLNIVPHISILSSKLRFGNSQSGIFTKS